MGEMGYLVVQEELAKVVRLDYSKHNDFLLVVVVQETEKHPMVEKVEADLVVRICFYLEKMANLTQEVVVVVHQPLGMMMVL